MLGRNGGFHELPGVDEGAEGRHSSDIVVVVRTVGVQYFAAVTAAAVVVLVVGTGKKVVEKDTSPNR